MENIMSAIYMTPQKKLVKSGILFFVAITALYLVLLGSILGNMAQKKELTDILEKESQGLFALEDLSSRENNNLSLNSFLELGYAESQKFDVIKTTRNVASIQAPHY